MKRGRKRCTVTFGPLTRNAVGSATGVNSDSFYDCKSGVTISIFLALSLAWIPYIGPIVAGFIGGRRAGSILRGLFVGLLSAFVVFGVAFFLSLGVDRLFEPGYQSFINSLEGLMPFFVDVLVMLAHYLSNNFVTVSPDMSISPVIQTYVSIIGFAIIGGVFADQARKELRIVVSQSMNASRPKPRRSTLAYLEGRDRGFQTYGDLIRMSVDVVCASIEAERSEEELDTIPVHIVPEPVDLGLITSEAVTTVQPVSESVLPIENELQAEGERKAVRSDTSKSVRKVAVTSDDLEWL